MSKLDISNLVTKGDLTETVDAATKRTDLLLTGVVVVMFIGFITLLFALGSLLIDSNASKSEVFNVLNNNINTLIQQNNQNNKDQRDQQIQSFQDQIDSIKKHNPYLKP